MDVRFTKQAQKQLLRAPSHCQVKAQAWIKAIRTYGMEEVRKIQGYHDEPLKGEKAGRRSIRLNKQWRLEYKEDRGELIVTVVEVHAHKY